MKRTIGFLATLMFAFVLAFGFVVNTASAETASPATVKKCTVTATRPCVETIDAGEELDIFFSNLSSINVIFNSQTARNTAQITPTIGSQVQPPVNLQPGQITERTYGTIGTTSAFFINNAAVRPSPVELGITARLSP